MDAVFEQRVRERAYQIWKATGMDDGAADRHWLSAEQAVRSEAEQVCAKTLKSADSVRAAKSARPVKGAQPTETAKKTSRSRPMAEEAKNLKSSAAKTAAPRKSAKAAMSASA